MEHHCVKVYRDCMIRGPRKVVIEIYCEKGVTLLDRSRMVAGAGFARRLKRRVAQAKRRAEIMCAECCAAKA